LRDAEERSSALNSVILKYSIIHYPLSRDRPFLPTPWQSILGLHRLPDIRAPLVHLISRSPNITTCSPDIKLARGVLGALGSARSRQKEICSLPSETTPYD
jgi:hypothetical protein